MKSLITITIVVVLISTGLFAFADNASDQKPALPAGHPAVDNSSLPAGHPQVPATRDQLPAGHPQLPAGNDGLPSGHPTVNPVAPAPAGTKGSLTIKAVQATKGGPAIGADPVGVEYFNSQGQVIARSDTRLSDKGEVTIKDISLIFPVQPLITITHGAVEYKTPANIMDARRRDQTVEMNVFESTDQEPAWQVRMRHVIVTPAPEGLGVTEMVSVFNPADRSWTGKAAAPPAKPVTLAIALPANATQVQAVAGLNLVDGKLAYAGALQPGSAEFQFTYVVPARDDRAEISLVAPAETGSLFVFLPDDGTQVTSDDLKKVEVKPGMNLRENSRFFTAAPQKAGERIKFTVAGLKAIKPAAATPAVPTPGADAGGDNSTPATPGNESGIPRTVKIAAGATAGAIITVGVVIVLFKSPRTVGGSR